MLSTSPQKPQTKADIFFYSELGLTLGQVNAEHWLATESSRCSRLGTATCKPNNRSRRPDDTLCESNCDRSHECDIASLISSHGEKAGLLFTDAAHELLDSPRSEESFLQPQRKQLQPRSNTVAQCVTDYDLSVIPTAYNLGQAQGPSLRCANPRRQGLIELVYVYGKTNPASSVFAQLDSVQ
jgi:hypothetical protein